MISYMFPQLRDGLRLRNVSVRQASVHNSCQVCCYVCCGRRVQQQHPRQHVVFIQLKADRSDEHATLVVSDTTGTIDLTVCLTLGTAVRSGVLKRPGGACVRHGHRLFQTEDTYHLRRGSSAASAADVHDCHLWPPGAMLTGPADQIHSWDPAC